MTVKELIEQLQQFDPEMEVRIKGTDPTNWDYQNEIQDIFEDGTNWEDEVEGMEWDEDGNVISGKIVLLIDGGCF